MLESPFTLSLHESAHVLQVSHLALLFRFRHVAARIAPTTASVRIKERSIIATAIMATMGADASSF